MEDDLYSRIFAQESSSSEDELEKVTGIIKNIKVDEKPKYKSLKRIEIDDDLFLIENDRKENYITQKDFPNIKLDVEKNHIFTRPVSTTITLGGKLSNINFMEEELIKVLEPNDDIVAIKCNFGEKISPKYVVPEKSKKTNRGRKKKDKKKKKRKIQGSGKHFNSQISFEVISSNLQDDIPKLYKFKLFRIGKLQLPGVKPKYLPDVIEKIQKIIDLLNDYTDQKIELLEVIPFMKNYKFRVKLQPGQIIDLQKLKEIFMIIKESEEEPDYNITKMKEIIIDNSEFEKIMSYKNLYSIDGEEISFPEHPKIRDVKYTREDTKLFIKFFTPTIDNPKKEVRLNIFMLGKINILGAFHEEITKKIYNFILEIFYRFWELLIIDDYEEIISDNDYVILDYFDNVMPNNVETKRKNILEKIKKNTKFHKLNLNDDDIIKFLTITKENYDINLKNEDKILEILFT